MSLRDFYKDILPKSSGKESDSVAPKAYKPSAIPSFPDQPIGAGGNGQTIPNNGISPTSSNSGVPAVQGQLERLDALSVNMAGGMAGDGQTLKSLPDVMRASRGPRTRFFDPLALVYATGFRDRRFSLTYDTLRRTSYQLSLLGSIIHTRIKQVAAFAQPYRENRQIGYRIGFKDDMHNPTEEERKAIVELERMIAHCGYSDNPHASQPRDDFRTFLEKVTRDSLTFDQSCAVSGTLIELASGEEVPIEHLEKGMLVRTHSGKSCEIVDAMSREYAGPIVSIQANGRKLLVTAGHPVLTFRWESENHSLTWMAAADVMPGDYVLYPKSGVNSPQGDAVVCPKGGDFDDVLSNSYWIQVDETSLRCQEDGESVIVYNLEVEGDHSYIAQGFVSHNCFEIVPDTRGKPFEFRAVDAGTIRLAATYEGKKPTSNEPRKFHIGKEFSDRWRKEYGDEFSFYGEGVFSVQVIHGRIENIYTYNDLAFGIRNPRSDIWVNGYGFCLSGDSKVCTATGLIPIEDLVGEEFKVVICGQEHDAVAFPTGNKEAWKITFDDGRSVTCSKDHKFYAWRKRFEQEYQYPWEWRTLENISLGDTIACDRSMSTDYKKSTSSNDPIDFATVASIESLDRMLPMYDLTVDSDFHGFCVEGIIVHNSEIEMSLNTVMRMLWAEEYNCLTADTLITTDRGLVPIADLVGEEFKIWDGIDWYPAQSFITEKKPVVKTKLWNGLEVKSSPDHKFRVIPRESETGEPEWRPQKALKEGDTLLVDCKRIDPPMQEDLFLVGKHYPVDRKTASTWDVTSGVIHDPEFWEFIGFALGDGYWPSYTRQSAAFLVFPHPEKDTEVVEKMLRVCDKYGISLKMKPCNVGKSEEHPKGIPCLYSSHQTFLSWLYELGFQPSTSGKRIPNVLFQAPAWIREALLRGLFSADGHSQQHVTGYKAPTITVFDPVLRQDILRCLWSVGIASQEQGRGRQRKWGHTLRVQNVGAFVEQVGYIQGYKNEGVGSESGQEWRWDKLAPSTSQCLAVKLLNSGCEKYNTSRIRSLARGGGTSRTGRLAMVKAHRDMGWELPEELTVMHVPVDIVDLEPSGEEVMYDVEVFNDRHLILANSGISVANSRNFKQGNMANGVLNFKGESYDPAQMESFRRTMRAQAIGVENCLHGDTEIFVGGVGAVGLEEYLDGAKERYAMIWDGEQWSEGRVFRAREPKVLATLLLNNGQKVKASPDHKFRVLQQDGGHDWKRLEEICPGDFVLTNQKEVRDPISGEVYNKGNESVGTFAWGCAIGSVLADLCYSCQDIVCDGRGLPDWVYKYDPVAVQRVTVSGERVPMFDVEMFTEEHKFMANGIYSSNSHRMPIMQVPDGLEFVSFMRGNKEMEYGRWLEYLLKTISGIYQIDPTEINFDIGKANSGGSPLFETKQEWRIKYSRDKGLRPLLKFIADQLTKYVIEPLDNRLYLDFVGLDQVSEPDRITMLSQRSKWMTWNEIRREEGLDAIDGGDVIADPGFLQIYMQQAAQGASSIRENANPFAPWNSSGDNDPEKPENITPIPLYLQNGGDEFGPQQEGGMPGMPGMGGMLPGGPPPGGPMEGEGLPPPGPGAAGGIEE